MMQHKNLIIVLVIVAALAVGYHLYQQRQMNTVKVQNFKTSAIGFGK